LYGADRYAVYPRKQVLSGKEDQPSSFSVMNNDPETTTIISDKKRFPYREWMEHAGFKLVGTWEKGNGKTSGIVVDVLSKDLKLIP
jgi:hypothetical protein